VPHTKITSFLSIFIVIGLAPTSTGAADPAATSRRLDVTRDAWVSAVGQEVDGNNGAAPRLKLKSIQEMSLVDIDAKPLAGRTIRSAALHVKKTGDERLWRVTVSSVGAEWFEGTGTGYAIQPGGATFRHRRHPDLPWSIGGGDFCNVVLGNGGTIWRMSDASPPDREGWQTIPVAPEIVAARLVSLSYGFLVFDDTGSEWTRTGEKFVLQIFPNRFVYSRDQNPSSAPYFTIEPGPEDRLAPAAPGGLKVEPGTADLPAGEALVSWLTPRDQGPAGTLGFFVNVDGRAIPRELIPSAGAPGARVEMHVRDFNLAPGATAVLAVSAVDGAGNVGTAATIKLAGSTRVAAPLPQPRVGSGRDTSRAALPRLGGHEIAIVDELDKIHPLTGAMIPDEPEGYLSANHLWHAESRTITLQATRNEFLAFQVLLRGANSTGHIQPTLVFDGPNAKTLQVQFGRYHPVASKLGALPDPIVPLSVSVNETPGTINRSLHAEVYVPHNVPAGEHRGTLILRDNTAQDPLRLAVSLRVWDFTLPDHLSFLPEMNCYGLPPNERDYYRLAHQHRTVLNRLPYNQNGQLEDGCAPRWDNRRMTLDWSAWDRRFGPLLDGSAFADLPRRSVPVECFYLPLHENWPSPMEGNYNGDYWADRAFPESYRRAFVAATRQIAGHFHAKKWNATLFHGFLNNKNNFKARGWSRGSSPWLLDEPANFQDYWALHFFARAFHEGVNQAFDSSVAPGTSVPKLVFRADISRPQWRRDCLDGLLDYHVVGSAMRGYPRLVFDRKRTLGEIVVEYGSTNGVEGSNFQPVCWCWDAWSLGSDGVLPWQTIGNAESWIRADELSLFYPGRGTGQAAAPIPSVRLKAYRRGQQDVEYLTLWSQRHNQPRWAVGQQIRSILSLTGKRQGTGFTGGEDAGRIDYGRLRPREVWALRVALGEALSLAHPTPKPMLVEFRTPRRHPEQLRPVNVGANAER
jgi:hypothetical protein